MLCKCRRKEYVIMHECIRPYQFVKEDKSDVFFKKNDKYFIKTKYGGVVETTKEYYEKFEGKQD